MLAGSASMKNCIDVCKKNKNRAHIWPTNSTFLTSIPQSYLNIVTRIWKQPRYNGIEERIKNLLDKFMKEYDTSTSKDEVAYLHATWMEQESLMTNTNVLTCGI